jgi:hypothetical protein
MKVRWIGDSSQLGTADSEPLHGLATSHKQPREKKKTIKMASEDHYPLDKLRSGSETMVRQQNGDDDDSGLLC